MRPLAKLSLLGLLLFEIGVGFTVGGPGATSWAYRVSAKDHLRLKMWSMVGTGQDFQVALKVKFIPASSPGQILTFTKIITPPNDRGITAASGASFPFGSAAAGPRTVSDCNTTSGSGTVTCASGAFTSAMVGTQVTLSGAGTACSSVPCQGPNFPTTTLQGYISAFTSSTQVTVIPNATVTQNTSSAVMKLEPPLLDDEFGQEAGDGWIVGADINFFLGSSKRGQAYFELEVNKGTATLGTFNLHEGITLVRNYLESTNHISWPFGRSYDRCEGPGYLNTITIADPAAGVQISQTVPANTHWRIQSLRFALVTDNTVANRFVALRITDGTNIVYDASAQVAQTASLTWIYTFGPGMPYIPSATVTNLRQSIPLPNNLILPAGYVIDTSTAGFVAGDNFAVPFMLIEECLG